MNECEYGINNCSKNSICENQLGSYKCICLPGYTGDGTICSGNILLVTWLQ